MIHPAIRDLFLELNRHPEFQKALRRLTSGGPATASMSGLTNTAKAIYLVLMWQFVGRPLIVIVDGSKQAETLRELIGAFFEVVVADPATPRPVLIPALDVLPHQRLSPHPEIAEQRVTGMWRLAKGSASIAVTPVASALLRTDTPEAYRQLALTLASGEELPLELLVEHLESVGYQRREPVEMVGEYSVRGGILDIFPAEAEHPVRIEMFGDAIESMRRFDPASQRSVFKIDRCLILPLVEWPQDRKLLAAAAARANLEFPPSPGDPFPGWEFFAPLARPRSGSILDLSPSAAVVIDEPEQVASAAERLWIRLAEGGREPSAPPEATFHRWAELQPALAGRSRVDLRELEIVGAASDSSFAIASKPSMAFRGKISVAVAEARNLVEQGNRVVFFAPSAGELERLADIFQEYAVPFQLGLSSAESTPQYLAERAYLAGSTSNIWLVRGQVRRGVALPESRLAIVGSEDLFETSDLVARPDGRRRPAAAFAADIGDLKPGDFVVHASHGMGKFLGLREISHGEQSGDFMLLEYADGARLYVPLTRLDQVQKYRSVGDSSPPLDRLGGATWTRTKSRVKTRLRDMADELLKLYAERQLAQGHAFSSDSNWQREFDDAFEYVETTDQLTAIKEIKTDMERTQPMDRLLCGDVGYGKTEVAMRAAFKALGDGKQVAVLAPTTVLSFQHFETFKSRFAPFPVRIEMLSRFRSAKELKDVVAGVADGKVDVVIGTHRLLSKDVEFRDLGLLIVDEEQRFGVRHKERLKQLRKNVDVLTLTATPIPRTLHMSLLGIRDLSVIETPPKDRLAIQTVVAHYHPELIKSAIEQELARGGQVYFIHNRVETIWSRAAAIQDLLPSCRIGVGHGQMPEAELERVLLGFMRHEYDVFVSTTIVENGLDIPLANTIIIDNADRYGLSELYQLRGRVGRSNRRAYAYLLVPPDAELSEVARKRLAALKEFSDLGSGFKIAALDLELRGGGNLLGGEQHGHINLVGFDTYLRLLEQTVQELKGEEVPLEIQSKLSLGLDIRIPPEYIEDEQQRLRSYKRIADAATADDAAKVLGDLEDRYGKAPEPVHNLLRFSMLKSLAQKLGIEAIERRGGAVNIKFHPESKVDPGRLMTLVREVEGSQFTPAGVLRVPVNGQPGAAELLAALEQRLTRLS
ncbi:MAG: transcription-repair coupling factor [Bryobacteraceae bacterium]|nr:transcription-repair coupling factor [Bryobacteraceae bacterium]